MNKRAYTLIELLAVIAILAILGTIAVVSVINYINKSNETSYNTLVYSIKGATELYVSNHSVDYPELNTVGSSFDIELNDLVNDGYIKSHLIDERNGSLIPLTTKVHITVTGQNKIQVDFSL